MNTNEINCDVALEIVRASDIEPKEVKNMTNLKLVLKMTEYEGGCVERQPLLKVFAFAKTIAEGEDVDDATKKF